MNRRSRWLALPAGIGLAFLMTTSVFGYVRHVPKTITVSPSSGTFTCDQWYTVRAKVLDQDGKPIKNLTVRWSFAHTPSSDDRIQPSTSKTNKHGVAVTSIKFACKLGERVIKATTDGISGFALVHVRLRGFDQHVLGITGTPGGTGGTLPNTSTSAAIDPPAADQPIPVVPAIIALLAALAIVVRRLTLARR
jgi:hypothetical protein